MSDCLYNWQVQAARISVLSHCRLMNVLSAGMDADFSNWADFFCQRIKLSGNRQLGTAFLHKLIFADHVHELDAGQDTSGSPK